MKKLFLFLLFQTFLIIQIYCQYDVYTPKGHIVEAYQNDSEMSDFWRNYWDSVYTHEWPYATKINTYGGYSSTIKFNCHGYAWHISEGGEYVWIGVGPNNKDEAIYWEDTNQSYIKIPSQYYPGGKVSYGYYGNHDHSAVVADPSSYGTGVFVSKWGDKVLMRHAYNYCPYEYDSIKFYKLNPNMTGSTSILCDNVQRTFNTDITHMSEATLTWTPGPYIIPISGTGTPHYIVEGSGNGSSYVNFQITTPSGFYWSSSKNFWAGKFENTVVTGQAAVCPNTIYTYTAQVPGGHSPSYTYYWTYPNNWMYPYQYQNKIQLQTPSNPNYGTVRVSIKNICGTSGYSGITVYPGYCGEGGGYYITSPNPADSYIVIDVDKEKIASENINLRSEYVLTMIDKVGMIIHTAEIREFPYKINTNKLPDGFYIINLNCEGKMTSIRIIIEH